MIVTPVLVQKLRRLILMRLLVIALFLTFGAIMLEMPPLVYYGVLSAFLFLSLLYIAWLASEHYLESLTYFQMTIDLIAISLFVYCTGGVDSAFVTLYALLIVSAGFVLYRNAPMFVAVASSLCFIAVVGISYSGWISVSFTESSKLFWISRDWLYCLYMTYVRVTVFLMVGFLSEYLVRAVDKMERLVQVKEKFSLIGEMAAHLAHEIRNPLMSISGSIEYLQEDLKPKLSAESREVMQAIISESERLKELFEKVLDFTKLEKLDLHPVNLKEVLDEVFLLLNYSQENGHAVRIHHEYRKASERMIYADRNRIKQVFLNIVSNAIEAMPDGGDLSIHIEKADLDTRIIFEDSGVGMSRKERAGLFIPFKSGKKGGTGLGLALAHKIVRSHGGSISVKSKVGRGSTFAVVMPGT